MSDESDGMHWIFNHDDPEQMKTEFMNYLKAIWKGDMKVFTGNLFPNWLKDNNYPYTLQNTCYLSDVYLTFLNTDPLTKQVITLFQKTLDLFKTTNLFF